MPWYHILDTFFCWLRSHREHLTKPGVSHWSENSSILLTSGSTDFFLWKGSTLPTSSCKVMTSLQCLMLPLQNNITSQLQQPVQNIEVLQVIVVRKRNLWMMETHAFEHTLVTTVGCITVLLLQEAGGSKLSEFMCSLAPVPLDCASSYSPPCTPSLFPFVFSIDNFCLFFRPFSYKPFSYKGFVLDHFLWVFPNSCFLSCSL